jgi:ABC-type lipoprotein export system ATPase subunit
MVTHDPRILELADRIVELEDGSLVERSESATHGALAPE